MRQILLIIFCFISLVACQTKQDPKIPANLTSRVPSKWEAAKEKLASLESYVVTGKTAYSKGIRGGNSTLRWEQAKQKYVIELSAPIGSGTVRITGQPNMVSLMQPNGALAVAKTPESLLQQTLGFEIPISGLQFWSKGIPSSNSKPTRMMFDKSGRMAYLEQEGWTIQYLSFHEVKGLTLPEQITLENGPIKLKLLFNQWNFSGSFNELDKNNSKAANAA